MNTLTHSHPKGIGILILFIIWITCSSIILSQSKTKADSLYDFFTSRGKVISKDQLGDVFKELNKVDTSFAKILSAKLLHQTSTYKDKEPYIRALIYDDQFGSFEKKIKEYREAYDLARQINDLSLLGDVEENAAMLFKQYEQFDSSMIHILRAKADFEKSENNYQLVSVLHTIADLHFYAELYDEADSLYKEVIRLKGDPVAWNGWRKVVVTNDLGEIEIIRKNFARAINYFTNSVNYIFSRSRKFSRIDSTQLAYTYFLLSNTNLLQKNYTQALNFYNKAILLSLALRYYENQIKLYITYAEICYFKGSYNTSLVSLKKAEQLLEKFPILELKIYLFKTYAKTFQALRNFEKASYYQQRLIEVQNLYDEQVDRAKFMHIYAENNYDKLNREIKTIRKENTFLIIIISLGCLFFTVVSFMFFKIRKSNLRLVEKSLELMKVERHEKLTDIKAELNPNIAKEKADDLGNVIENSNISEKPNGEIGNEEEPIENSSKDLSREQLKTLAENLNSLVTEQKLFLDQDISLQQLSKLLKTNRSYLSRAINVEYGYNFPTYINNERIKEAIRMISLGNHKLLTLEAIASEVGFNNRTSFTIAFKKYTGVSPSFFIKNLSTAKLD